MRRSAVLLALVAVAQLILPRASHADDWTKAREEFLKARYELTKTGIGRVRITKPGTVLVIQEENISVTWRAMQRF
jgi:hypothetical protein